MVRETRRHLNNQSPYPDLRLISKIIYSASSLIIFTKDSLENKAKNILQKYMESSSNKFHIQQRFLEYITTVLKVQKIWNVYQEKKRERIKFLTFKFDYELENMIDFCKEAKNKRYKILLKKLENINPEIKAAMMDLYYRKAQHIFAARFYEWRKIQLSKKGVSLLIFNCVLARIR